ncbi:MAG: hypothetical protein JNK12_02615 [Acidimicrobiales bacterium]|nr:hypothetical protein [Acidimicrobiales bacterium]
MPRRLLALTAAAALAFVLVACGGGDGDDESAVTAAPLATTPDNTAAPATTAAPDSGDTGDDAVGGAVDIDSFASDAGITESGDSYSEFVQVSDDSDQIFVEVPAEWDDLDTTASSDGNPSIQASPDLGGDIESTPILGYTAVQFTSPPDLDEVISQTAAASTRGECEAGTPNDYSDGVFSGRIQAFVNCGGDDRAWLFVAAIPDNGDSYATVIFGQAVTLADVDALQHAFDTFNTNV